MADDVMIDGKKKGEWTWDCKTGMNLVKLDFYTWNIDIVATTGAQTVAQAVGDGAKALLPLVHLSADDEKSAKEGIDAIVKAFPGAIFKGKMGWFIDYDAPKCDKGPDKVRYLQYSVFFGVRIFATLKVGPADVTFTFNFGKVEANCYHRCDCGDTVGMSTTFLGETFASLSTPIMSEGSPVSARKKGKAAGKFA